MKLKILIIVIVCSGILILLSSQVNAKETFDVRHPALYGLKEAKQVCKAAGMQDYELVRFETTGWVTYKGTGVYNRIHIPNIYNYEFRNNQGRIIAIAGEIKHIGKFGERLTDGRTSFQFTKTTVTDGYHREFEYEATFIVYNIQEKNIAISSLEVWFINNQEGLHRNVKRVDKVGNEFRIRDIMKNIEAGQSWEASSISEELNSPPRMIRIRLNYNSIWSMYVVTFKVDDWPKEVQNEGKTER